MTTLNSQLQPIQCLPGVQPSTDKTAYATQHYTAAQGIRFRFGQPEKIGGWASYLFDGGAAVAGVCRSIFSAAISGRVQTLLGTSSGVYSLLGTGLTNITPLQTATNAIPNSISTDFVTLGANPIATTSGSNIVTITDPNASLYQPRDLVTLANATATGGIGATALNQTFAIQQIVDATHYTIATGTNATGTVNGGGATVTRGSGLVTFAATAQGQATGQRVKIVGATATGGLTAPQLNQEFIIRSVQTNSFSVVVSTATATSAVTAGGGAATTYQKQFSAGRVNASLGQVYGMGRYGVGFYGTSKLSSAGIVNPRFWYFDRFGNILIMTPGEQNGVYQWSPSPAVAPTLVPNAPTAVNYAYISNNILMTLGTDGVPNRVRGSDQGNIQNWTASSTNQVFSDDIEGAGQFLTHVSLPSFDLVFTSNQVWKFRYIGLPFIWEITLEEQAIGIVGPFARCSVGGTAYWMDDNGFYQCDGGDVTVMQSNSQEQSTLLNWMFQNMNGSQKSKAFAWFNPEFNEIWFHAPSTTSSEPDKIARYHIIDKTWTPDMLPRTAAEYPAVLIGNPRLANQGVIYKHELGADADGQPLPWKLSTNLRANGKKVTIVDGFIPDSEQVGNITTTLTGYRFPQSQNTSYSNSYTVTPVTERIPAKCPERFYTYTWSGSQTGQTWRMGQWLEYVSEGAGN